MKKQARRLHSGQANPRLLLTCVVATTFLLVACRILITIRPGEDVLTRKNFEPPTASEQRGPKIFTVPTVLAAEKRYKVPSEGSFSVQFNFVDSFPGAITEMGPKGDFLYSETVRLPQNNEIHLRSQHKNIKTFTLEAGANFMFSREGKLVKKRGLSSYDSPVPRTAVCLALNDGSFLTHEVIAKGKSPTYAILRANDNGPVETIYSSKMPSSLLERSDDETLWIGSGSRYSHSALFRRQGKAIAEVPFPDGFQEVLCVSHTKGLIAATFGSNRRIQPYRTFVLEGKNWRELPMPNDFDCSFVQAITNDGLIFGLVSDVTSERIQQIVWKDKAFQMVGAPPNWPSRKDLPLIDKMSREGNVSFIDRASEEGWKTYLYSIRAN